MTGKDIRLQKLFSKGENAVIVAVDHGVVNGPVEGLENMAESFERFHPPIDGVLLSPGMLKSAGGLFSFRGAPMPIARITWNSSYCFYWGYDKAFTSCIFGVKDAIALGAEMVVLSLALKTGSEENDAKNVELFARLCNECREYGIPVMGEIYPGHSDTISKEEIFDQVLRGSRILAELGADIVKTFLTIRFDEVVRGCPLPILGLGGEKTPDPVDSLKLARKMIDSGCKGVVFGRNAIQRPDPAAYQKALCEVVKHGADPVEAAQKYLR